MQSLSGLVSIIGSSYQIKFLHFVKYVTAHKCGKTLTMCILGV